MEEDERSSIAKSDLPMKTKLKTRFPLRREHCESSSWLKVLPLLGNKDGTRTIEMILVSTVLKLNDVPVKLSTKQKHLEMWDAGFEELQCASAKFGKQSHQSSQNRFRILSPFCPESWEIARPSFSRRTVHADFAPKLSKRRISYDWEDLVEVSKMNANFHVRSVTGVWMLFVVFILFYCTRNSQIQR